MVVFVDPQLNTRRGAFTDSCPLSPSTGLRRTLSTLQVDYTGQVFRYAMTLGSHSTRWHLFVVKSLISQENVIRSTVLIMSLITMGAAHRSG